MTLTKTERVPIRKQSYQRILGLSTSLLVQYLPFILLVVIISLMGIYVEHFLTYRNIHNVLMQSSALALMAIGMSVVLITGGIDLSLPATMAFSAIMGAMFMRDIGSPVIGSLIMVLVGTFIGGLNGVAVAYFRMIPFVVTLAMQAILMGASTWVTNQVSIPVSSEAFFDAVLGRIGGVGTPIIFLVFITLIIQLFMKRSMFGRWLYATGTNARAARVSGVPTQKVIFFAYVFSGFMAGLAAIILTARLNSAGALMGREGVVLDIVSSAVLGGVSIYGGIGSALNAVVGAILITLISNSMNMMQVSYYMTLVVKGFVIIGVIALEAFRRR